MKKSAKVICGGLMVVGLLLLFSNNTSGETYNKFEIYMWEYTSEDIDGVGQGENDIYFILTINDPDTGEELNSYRSSTVEDSNDGNFSYEEIFTIGSKYNEIEIVIEILDEDTGSDDMIDIDNSSDDDPNSYTSLTIVFDFQSGTWSGDDTGDSVNGGNTEGNRDGDGDGTLTYNIRYINTPPEIELISPIASAIVFNRDLWSLTWDGTDDNNHTLKFDVYLDTNSTPVTLVASDIENEKFTPDVYPEVNQTYYWRVTVKDGYENEESEIWSFTIRPDPVIEDDDEVNTIDENNGLAVGFPYYTERGDVMNIWIKDIYYQDGTTGHPIDIYVGISQDYYDHSCSAYTSDTFNPPFVKENLNPYDLPFNFTFEITTDDTYYFIIDNCDNQRDSDYNEDTSKIIVVYSIIKQFSHSSDDDDAPAPSLTITLVVVATAVAVRKRRRRD